jgi:hypothetical protein
MLRVKFVGTSIAVLALLGLTTVASATQGTQSGTNRAWMTCPSPDPAGQLESVTVDPTPQQYGYFMHAAFDVAPCQPPRSCDMYCPVEVYAIGVVYAPGAEGYFARYLDLPPDGRSAMDFLVRFGAVAVCLYTENGARADCVLVTWPAGNGPPVVGAHIPGNDPLVIMAILVPSPGGVPGCPTCWD